MSIYDKYNNMKKDLPNSYFFKLCDQVISYNP